MRCAMPLIVALTVTSCIGAYRTTTDFDHVANRRVVRLTKNVIGGLRIFGDNLTINPMRIEDEDGVRFALLVQWLSEDWLFISSGQSLTFRIDGERLYLSGTVMSQDVGICAAGGCDVDERAEYPITPDELRRIAEGNTVYVRLEGRSKYAERQFSSKNLENFRRFIAEYVDP